MEKSGADLLYYSGRALALPRLLLKEAEGCLGMENTMDISSVTKLAELFKQYPFLKDELIKFSDKFTALNNPLAKAVVSQVDLAQVSQTSGIDVNTLIAKIKEIIASHQA